MTAHPSAQSPAPCSRRTTNGALAGCRRRSRCGGCSDGRVRGSGSGTITTIAGTGTPGFSGDGGPATRAKLDGPQSVALDRQGNVYILDARNNRVRRVSPGGKITTIAGGGKGDLNAGTVDLRLRQY